MTPERSLDQLLITDASDLSLIGRLVRDNRDLIWRSYPFAIVLTVLLAAATAGMAALVARLVHDLFVARDGTGIALTGAMIGGLYLVRGAAGFGQARILARAGNAIVARCQTRVFERLLGEGVHTIRDEDGPRATARLTHSARSARSVLEQLFSNLLRDVCVLLALLGVMVAYAPGLATIVLLSMPIIAGVAMWLSRQMRIAVRSEFPVIARIIAVTREAVGGARIIRAFGAQDMIRRQMGDAVEEARRTADRIAAITARTGPIIDGLGGLSIVAVLILAGGMVARDTARLDDLVAFVTAMLVAYGPARRLAQFNVTVAGGLMGLRLMYGFIDQVSPAPGASDLPAAAVSRGHVRLEGVTFGYDPARPVLRDVTMEARPGSVTAIVGPSGSGKTTLLSLIEGFIAPQAGRVLVDEQDLREIRPGSLGGKVALVTQDTFLFAGTIAENIACGFEGATRDDVERAAAAADADGFIGALPQGYETAVGGDAAVLSAGQMQRIAIARALLRDPPILLLDEATAALDPVTEARVQAALGRLMAGRTTIVVAHRLAMVRDAARIHLLEEGRIVAAGTHEELLAESETYRVFNAVQDPRGP